MQLFSILCKANTGLWNQYAIWLGRGSILYPTGLFFGGVINTCHSNRPFVAMRGSGCWFKIGKTRVQV